MHARRYVSCATFRSSERQYFKRSPVTCLSWISTSTSIVQRKPKCYSSSTASRVLDVAEEHLVKCGSTGSVTIDLHNPSSLSTPTTPLIIYLPPLPAHIITSAKTKTKTKPALPHILSSLSLPIAQINYRWNHILPPSPSRNPSSPLRYPPPPTHPFPIPIHDTLLSFTYLTRTLLRKYTPPPSPSTPSRTPWAFNPAHATPPTPQRPLLIYGSHLGATLATSLALTETFSSRSIPFKIVGLIAKNGVYDWTGIATSPHSSQSSHPHSSSLSNLQPSPLPDPNDSKTYLWNNLDLPTLHRLKHLLFSYPGNCFDTFASPLLFFRTSGLVVPRQWPGSSPDSTSSSSASPSSTSIQVPVNESAKIVPGNIIEEEEEEEKNQHHELKDLCLEKPSRRAHLRFPPRDSGLRIPPSLFLYTQPHTTTDHEARGERGKADVDGNGNLEEGGDLLKSQAEEMASLMRRSVRLHEFKDRRMWDEDFDGDGVAEERVGVRRVGRVEVGVGDMVQDSVKLDNGEEEEGVKTWIEDVLGK